MSCYYKCPAVGGSTVCDCVLFSYFGTFCQIVVEKAGSEKISMMVTSLCYTNLSVCFL